MSTEEVHAQYVTELMRRKTKVKEFRQVITKGNNDVWGADLADFSSVANDNDGYKYALVVIDAFSRYAWAQPLKNKTPQAVWAAMQTILDDANAKPERLWVDQGTEFYNKLWTDKLKQLNITRYSTFGEYKVSIAERFIRTLKTNLFRQFLLKGKQNWVDILQDQVDEYNDTPQAKLDMSPKEARSASETALWKRLYKQTKRTRPKFQLGDWVRISRVKGRVEKGFHPNWSYQVFKIRAIRLNKPVTYYLSDYYGEEVTGAFYEPELQEVADHDYFPIEKVLKTRTRNGVKELYAKFLGYDKPAWVPATSTERL